MLTWPSCPANEGSEYESRVGEVRIAQSEKGNGDANEVKGAPEQGHLAQGRQDVVHPVVDSKCYQCETDVREELLEMVGLTICVAAGHDAHNELAA